MKILFTDSITMTCCKDIDISPLKQFGQLTEYKNISRAELEREIVDTDILILNKVPIDEKIIGMAKKLKYIGITATGYNCIDISAAKKRNIPVCNVPSYSTNAVTQQVIGYILMHYTKIPEYDRLVHSGEWENGETFSLFSYPTVEAAGKTLGIIGYGNIGKAVKKAAEGLGMNVIVNTRTVRNDGGTRFVDLDTLLKESDIVSLHCPLTSETEKLINAERLAQMKDGAFLINTSRGGTVDENALFDALKSGKLSGAAVDVLSKEPPTSDNPLLKAKNIIITPHTAWIPFETRKRLFDIVVDNLASFLKGNTKNNVAV